jgi:hypothetical protein
MRLSIPIIMRHRRRRDLFGTLRHVRLEALVVRREVEHAVRVEHLQAQLHELGVIALHVEFVAIAALRKRRRIAHDDVIAFAAFVGVA